MPSWASAFASVPGVIIIGTGVPSGSATAQRVGHEPDDLGVGRPLDRRQGHDRLHRSRRRRPRPGGGSRSAAWSVPGRVRTSTSGLAGAGDDVDLLPGAQDGRVSRVSRSIASIERRMTGSSDAAGAEAARAPAGSGLGQARDARRGPARGGTRDQLGITRAGRSA